MSALGNLLRELRSLIRGAIGRAVIRLVDDANPVQATQLEIHLGEMRTGERLTEYGFTSVPKPGSEAVVLSVGAMREHLVVVATDDRRYRLAGLQSGEVALYDDLGNYVKLGRNLVTVNGVTKVRATAPTVELAATTGGARVVVDGSGILLDGPVSATSTLHATGDVTTDGNVTATGDVSDLSGTAQTMAAMRSIYDVHGHNVFGGGTGPPTNQM